LKLDKLLKILQLIIICRGWISEPLLDFLENPSGERFEESICCTRIFLDFSNRFLVLLAAEIDLEILIGDDFRWDALRENLLEEIKVEVVEPR